MTILDDFTTPHASSWPGWTRYAGAPTQTRATAASSVASGAGRTALTWQAGAGVTPAGFSQAGDGWWRASGIAGLPAWLVRSRFTVDAIAGFHDAQVVRIGAATIGGSPLGSDPYVYGTLWAPGTSGTFNLLLWGWDDIGFPDVGTSVDAVLEAGVEYIVELAYAFGLYSLRVWRADESRSTAIVKQQAGNYVNPAYVNLGYDAGASYGTGSFPVAATLVQKATGQSDVGQATVTMPAAITPGNLLVFVASGRTGGIDLSPHIGASTGRPFTTWGETQAFLGRGFLDIAYRIATGDERPLVFNTQHANITLYEFAGAGAPASFQVKSATLQGAATTKALAAFTAPGSIQIAGFIWDEHIANQTVGAGYTQDAQFVSLGNLEPGYLSAHATSGATAQISGTPYSWAGMAVGIAPAATTLVQKAGVNTGVGGGFSTMPAPVTAGNLLIVTGTKLSLDSSHVFVHGSLTARPFTEFPGSPVFPIAGSSDLHLAYRIATGDEQSLDWQSAQALVEVYEVAFAGATPAPAGLAMTLRSLQAASSTKALPALAVPGALQIMGYAWAGGGGGGGVDLDQTVAAGWTQDAQIGDPDPFGHIFDPGLLAAHATTGPTPSISGGSKPWAGIAVGIPSTVTTAPNWDGAAGASTISFLYIEVAEYIPELGWDVYRAADPNGAMRVRIQDDDAPLPGAYERSVRVALNEPGSGAFKINRHASTAALLARGDIVKCRFPWRTQYDAAFIIEQGEFQLSSTDEQGGEELDFGGRGILAYLDRAVMWDKAYSVGLVTSPTWTEAWNLAFTDPVGIAQRPGDLTYVYVLGRYTHRISKVRQSDRGVATVSPALFTHDGGGLSADPSDATLLWAIETPWLSGGTANTKIYKIRASDWAILATLDLGSAVHLSDLRADGSNLWTTNRTTDKIEKRSKSTGALVTAYAISYLGVPQTGPTGISVNGTRLAYWFDNGSSSGATRALISSSSSPTVITSKISTTAISSFGGDWTTEAGLDYFYMVSYVHDRVWKYALTAPVPQGPIDGTWVFLEGTAGAILWRIMLELQDALRPQKPIPGISYGFGSALDSGGHAWQTDPGAAEYTAGVGDSALDTVQRLVPFGINVKLSPTLVLRGDNAATYGVNRASATFEDGIRFEKGVNIAAEILRRDREVELHSQILASGAANLYAVGTLDDLGYVREGFLSTELTDGNALAGTANAELDNERIVQERIVIRVAAGDDPVEGLYRPFRDYDIGDLVRLHTGYEAHDYTELDVRLYGMTLEEGETGDWPTVVLELGSAFLYSAPTTSSGSGSTAAVASGASGGAITFPDTIIEGTDSTGATTTRAVGRTLRAVGWSVYQEAAGVVRLMIGEAARLLRLADVDADDIADGQLLAWDAARSVFVPGGLVSSSSATIANGGTATFGSTTVAWIRIGKLVVFSIAFGVTANGSGATAVAITATGLPAPSTSFDVVGERDVVGAGPILARCVSASGELQISRLNPVSIGVAYADQSALPGSGLLTGATYAFQGAYIAA